MNATHDSATTFRTGDRVNTIDDMAGERVITTGVVERVTDRFVHVRNAHGNLVKYHQNTGRMIGYSYPMLTCRIVRA